MPFTLKSYSVYMLVSNKFIVRRERETGLPTINYLFFSKTYNGNEMKLNVWFPRNNSHPYVGPNVNVVNEITSEDLWNIVSKPVILLQREQILSACLPEVDSSTLRYRLWAERLVKRLLRAA